MKEKRKPIKARIRIWHGTCNIKTNKKIGGLDMLKQLKVKGMKLRKNKLVGCTKNVRDS